MATIKTAISLYDGVTGPMRSMVKVMDTVISGCDTAFDHVQLAGQFGQFGTCTHHFADIDCAV